MSNAALNWAYNQDVIDENGRANPTAKFVLVTLANYANENGDCWRGQDTLAKLTGYTKRTIITALNFLEGQNLIVSEERRDSNGHRLTNLYRLPTAAFSSLSENVSPCKNANKTQGENASLSQGEINSPCENLNKNQGEINSHGQGENTSHSQGEINSPCKNLSKIEKNKVQILHLVQGEINSPKTSVYKDNIIYNNINNNDDNARAREEVNPASHEELKFAHDAKGVFDQTLPADSDDISDPFKHPAVKLFIERLQPTGGLNIQQATDIAGIVSETENFDIWKTLVENARSAKLGLDKAHKIVGKQLSFYRERVKLRQEGTEYGTQSRKGDSDDGNKPTSQVSKTSEIIANRFRSRQVGRSSV